MAAGTLLFGLLPLGLRMSRLTLRILEVAGAGLLLGAATSVVLPEGAGTLFREGEGASRQRRSVKSNELTDADPESLMAVSFLSGILVLFIIDQIISPGAHAHHEQAHGDEGHGHGHGHDHDDEADLHGAFVHERHQHGRQSSDKPASSIHSRLSRPDAMILTRSNAIPTLRSLEQSARQQGQHKSYRASQRLDDHASQQGSKMALGDGVQHPLSRKSHSPADSNGSDASLPADYHTISHGQDGSIEAAFQSQQEQRRHESSDLARNRNATIEGPLTGSSPSSPLLAARRSPSRSPPRSRHQRSGSSIHSVSTPFEVNRPQGLRAAFTSIAGLMIHAACDGVAMGASSASQDEGLKLVVLGAIMIHKAPAAFGLCSLLISQRLSKPDIKRAMAIFSLATPMGAISTYLLLSFVLGAQSSHNGESSISTNHVGSALTFSAGSFIYVAIDAVHELASSSSDCERDANGTPLPKQTLGRSGRIAMVLLGAVLPRTLQMLVGHGH
ncbi:unnamed protein product [Jaminaea pallidilutea]